VNIKITVQVKILINKEVKMINRAQQLVVKILFSTSNKDKEKRVFYGILEEIF
jgi:hypothetical protein